MKKGDPNTGMSIVGPIDYGDGEKFHFRLPVLSTTNIIEMDGENYNRWGFITTQISWDTVVEQTNVLQNFEASGFDFQLTRTDVFWVPKTDEFIKEVVVLAESPLFSTNWGDNMHGHVSTALETTNNEWVLTVVYHHGQGWEVIVAALSSIFVAFFLAFLIYTVLAQKHINTAIQARIEIERHMTAYFSHELRNPLSAIDCALASMPLEEMPRDAHDLVEGMQLCSSFMSGVMNNLLDSRKIEEGKMILMQKPLSLTHLIQSIHKMTLPACRPGVSLLMDISTNTKSDWVYGDFHRLQQVMTNIVTK